MLSVALLLAGPASAQWEKQSPVPMGLLTEAVAYPTPSHIVLGTENDTFDDHGALWESRDGGDTWTGLPVPPGAGSFDPINDVFFFDPQHGWAFGNFNFRTTDGGLTWQELPFLGSAYFVRFYTLDFGLTTGNFGRRVSRDGGLSWSPSPNGMLDFDFRDGQTGLGVSTSGVYRTTDGGQTFASVLSSSASDVVFLTADVALGIAGGAFVRSTDGGQTWTTGASAQGRDRLVPLSSQTVLASGVDGRLLRSADGGQTWADLGAVLPDGIRTIEALNEQTAVAVSTPDDVWRSADGGQTWTRTLDAPDLGGNTRDIAFADAQHGLFVMGYGLLYKTADGGASWAQISSGYGAHLYDADRFPSGRLIAVGDGATVLTSDDGVTWAVEDVSPLAVTRRFEAVHVVDDETVVLTDDFGRVYRSLDGGQTWVRGATLPDPFLEFIAHDLHFSTPLDGWVVGQRFNLPAIFHTTDGGDSWEVGYPDPGLFVGVEFEGDHGWILDNGGILLRTTDGGQTWSESSVPSFNQEFEDVAFYDQDVGYAVGWFGDVSKSTDGGETWMIVPTPGDDNFTAVYLTSPDDVWMSTGPFEDHVYHSADGGQTWEVLTIGSAPHASGSFSGIAASPDGRAWTVGWKGHIYGYGEAPLPAVTVDAAPMSPPVVIGPSGGAFQFTVTLTNTSSEPQSLQAWTEATGPMSRSPVLGPKNVTLPPGGSVMQTLTQQVPGNAPAGTYTYAVNAGSFPAPVTASDSFTLTKEGGALVARGGGAAAGWRVSGWEDAMTASATADLPEGFVLSEVSPNPFDGRARLTLEVAAAQHVTAEVYDALGRRVAVLLDGAAEAGAHALVLDGSVLPAGVYVVRVTGETFSATRQAVLLR